jgi:CelD/BcsL family acetyltransferase involved in cellulose biosynthesis
MSAIEAHVISDCRELAALAPDWARLWERCPNSTPFQSPGWLLPWWSAFAPGELMSIGVFSAGRLVGLAPLYLEANSAGQRLLPLGISLSDYVDVLIEPDFEAPVGEAMLRAIDREMRWSTLEWNELSPRAAALHLDGLRSSSVTEEISSACPVLALNDTSAGGAIYLPASKRRKLRMARHRAERRGEVEFLDTDAASAESLFELLVSLHGACWHARFGSGVLADTRVRAFHKEAIARLDGIVRLHALRIGGETAAVYYGFEHRERAYAYLSGFSPSFAHESPGSLLLEYVIAQSCRSGVREFHFLRGGESYKYEWGAHDRFNRRREFRRAAPSSHG